MSAVQLKARPALRLRLSWQPWIRTLRRVPRAGWICFLIGLINAGVWSVVLPPFQVPDESMHLSYAQYLAETGKLPSGKPTTTGADANGQFSPQENNVVNYTFAWSLSGGLDTRGVFTPAQQKTFERQMRVPASPVGYGYSTDQTNQPPLYYAYEALAYWLTPSSNLLARLAVMRLASAALLGATVLAIFLFLRELMPRSRWVWPLGALAVAFQPQVNSIAGGVNADNLLYFASAATFLALARGYRRGLTTRRAIAIGVVVAIGLLSKLTYWGLTPGIGLAVLLMAYRSRGEYGYRRAAKNAILCGSIAATPFVVYGLLNMTVWDRGGFLAGGLGGTGVSTVPLIETLEYIWDFYLPHLWFMHYQFPGETNAHTIWVNGFIGLFGAEQYGFPLWVYKYGQYLIYAVFWLAVIAGLRRWKRLLEWAPLAACVLVMAAGLVYEIGTAGVHNVLGHAQFEQARYMFPLLALYGLMVGLAPKALPRRWAPVLGAALLMIVMAHNFFGLTVTISRYYG